MIYIIIAFLVGCIYTRTYYARINTRTDWMRSWDWSNHKLFKKLHSINCEFCPKRWYCERYKIEKQKK